MAGVWYPLSQAPCVTPTLDVSCLDPLVIWISHSSIPFAQLVFSHPQSLPMPLLVPGISGRPPPTVSNAHCRCQRPWTEVISLSAEPIEQLRVQSPWTRSHTLSLTHRAVRPIYPS